MREADDRRAATAGRSRGRPFRFAEDLSQVGATQGGGDVRAGWLLAVTRLYSTRSGSTSRRAFAEGLRGLGVTCDEARLSRWESGKLRAPAAAVSAWERVAEVPTGRLSAVIAGLREVTPLPSSDPATYSTRLDTLIGRLDGGTARGPDWLEAAQLLAGQPWTYLVPEHWERLTTTLAREMLRAVDSEFVARYEALRTLLVLPSSSRHVLRAIGSLVTDPRAQWARMPTVLLQELDHPAAQDVTIKVLATGRPSARRGAAWAAATKLVRGHFDAGETRQLDSLVAVRLLTGEDVDLDLLDVAARLPDAGSSRVAAVLRGSERAATLRHLLRTGEVVGREEVREIVTPVARRAQATLTGGVALETDQMLHRLLREALFHGHQQRRHQATLLLAASPYRTGVADQLLELTGRPPEVSRHISATLRHLAVPHHAAGLHSVATGSSSPEVRAHALRGLGDLGELALLDGADHDRRHAVARLARTDPHPQVRRAAVYALGMSGASSLEHATRDSSEDIEDAEGAAWWRELGPAITVRPTGT